MTEDDLSTARGYMIHGGCEASFVTRRESWWSVGDDAPDRAVSRDWLALRLARGVQWAAAAMTVERRAKCCQSYASHVDGGLDRVEYRSRSVRR
ncbi:MAG TPA: hypothetical protein VIX73_31645, partial [Kofleriaceae bacterium]